MLTINCQKVKKYNAAQLVLEDVTFDLNHGEKMGLVGRNGSGKSTLLRLLSKQDSPDEGLLTIRKDARIGYLEQIPDDATERTVYDVLALGYRELLDCRSAMGELERRMSEPEAGGEAGLLEKLLADYSALQERFEREGGYELDARIDQVANGLGIDREWYARLYSSLSGGEKTKAGLASQLIRQPDLLLLDEPTNHLDLGGVEWLEEYLVKYEGACLIVSHDRYFLDRVVTKIVELEDGESSIYLTNYTDYLKEKEERLLQEFADYQEQQKKLKKMRETIKRLMEWGRIGDNGKFFRRAASMQKALDRIEKLKRPAIDRKEAEFSLKLGDRSGKRVLEFADLSKRYGDNDILKRASGAVEYGERIAIVGRNGAGKSTLLKILLGEEQAEEGKLSIGSRVDVGYLPQQQPPDDPKQSVLGYFREAAGMEEGEARSRLAAYLFYGADVFKPVGLLSGGEWTRLRLAVLVLKRPNLLVLDEPTNHMDIASREALEEALEQFPGTILAVTHDRYFINRVSRKIWELDRGALSVYLGDFDDYKVKSRERVATGSLTKGNPASVKGPAVTVKQAGKKREEAVADPAKLEREIASLEFRVRELDTELDEAGKLPNPAELERLWADREEAGRALELLYERWLDQSAE
ncbi:ABC transporter ATP-binding protein [Cohnella endophytica]|uniref:ABC transporter ATP-binding protein n=1 Tax=Cohnella endophytica TaxID=2419778 RepID=A0A494XPP6_9BACL|nr:ABC-F type ribosomal protection protein [Cohnella endophytica]RKP51681.1 ABC transporter ATP-binding protein [Cohnella endophytica]